MQLSFYEGGILQFLCRALKVKKAIEIGTLYGYSGLMIARSLPPGGRLFTLDLNADRQQKAQSLIQEDPARKKMHFITGEASGSLKKLETKGPFDMVFIDADKGAYLKYLHWSNQHLKPGGLLVADNAFLFGAVYGKPVKENISPASLAVMKQFNQEVVKGGFYISTILPTPEGMTVGIKKQESGDGL